MPIWSVAMNMSDFLDLIYKTDLKPHLWSSTLEWLSTQRANDRHKDYVDGQLTTFDPM